MNTEQSKFDSRAEIPAYRSEELPPERRAEDLAARMTAEECAAQMLFQSGPVERLGVESYNWWNEALHGVARAGMATVFPQAIGLASTFDTGLIYLVADAVSTEGRAKYNAFKKRGDRDAYKGINFWTPNINIFRDPRWGRGQETYGEDPFLTSCMGEAYVRGLQGNDPKYLKSAACAKHFAVHSGPEAGRHEFDAVVSKRDLAETYLPAFEHLVKNARVEGVMGAYNRVNGEPCCGSKTLLVDLLREKWGFTGYVTSDCGAIADFHLHHHVTQNALQSAALAVKNGCDLNCGTMYGYLLQALQEGLITEEDIRTCTRHLLATRFRLGMFDRAVPYDSIPHSMVDCDAHRRLNYQVSCESLVLLKNNGLLPLAPEKIKNVLVTGPNADSREALDGNYHGTANEYTTVLEALRRLLPEARVNYSRGSHLFEDRFDPVCLPDDGLTEIDILAEEADLVVAVVGFDETTEGEEMAGSQFHSWDREDLLLPPGQRNLLERVCAAGKPVVVVCMAGCAVDLGCANTKADAIVHAWYPGAQGGKAVADLLFGKFSPSGRLPVTFYSNENSLPPFEDYSMEGRTYKYFGGVPLYPFGFGLSYTEFTYSQFAPVSRTVHPGESPVCRVRVENTGNRAGREVVQLYIRDDEATVRVPRWQLCAVRSLFLEPHQAADVELTIDPRFLCVIDDDGTFRFEAGSFTLYAGGGQPDERTAELTGQKSIAAGLLLTDGQE